MKARPDGLHTLYADHLGSLRVSSTDGAQKSEQKYYPLGLELPFPKRVFMARSRIRLRYIVRMLKAATDCHLYLHHRRLSAISSRLFGMT
jgi:hypothetical protein